MRRALAGASLALAALAVPALAQHPAMDSAVARQLRTAQTPEVEVIGRARQVEGAWFLVVAVRALRLSGSAVTVVACVADSAATVAARCVPLPTPSIDRNLFAADSSEVLLRDLDGDGKADAVVGVSYGSPSYPAVGPTSFWRHYVVVFDPAPVVRANIATAEDPGASGMPHRSGHLTLEDVNGDGKPELVIRGQRCDQDPSMSDAACREYTQTWAYRPATRTWAPAPAARGR